MTQVIKRCDWATKNALEQKYHDEQWGIAIRDDQELFKRLCLEGMQAGLSWLTVLKKMEALNEAFEDFIPERLIQYDEEKIDALMQNRGIIRNRLKIKAVIKNAHAYLKICEEFGSFSDYLWSFVDHKPIIHTFKDSSEVPSQTVLSNKMSKDLKKRGFSFVGSTIVYAFMQATGMVNDHLMDCSFRR